MAHVDKYYSTALLSDGMVSRWFWNRLDLSVMSNKSLRRSIGRQSKWKGMAIVSSRGLGRWYSSLLCSPRSSINNKRCVENTGYYCVDIYRKVYSPSRGNLFNARRKWKISLTLYKYQVNVTRRVIISVGSQPFSFPSFLPHYSEYFSKTIAAAHASPRFPSLEVSRQTSHLESLYSNLTDTSWATWSTLDNYL